MDPERWKRVTALFDAVLECAPADREALLREACPDDPAIRAEVQSLVDAHDQADVFEKPAYEANPDLLAPDDLDPLVGQRLGPYRITKLIGHGGMGVVYLGEDTRLRRPVAIKALPSDFTHDERSRERLRREAMAAASLSHPNIATVFALEEFDGLLYLVGEYVEGQTLREELRNGPVPISVVMSVAVDIGAALEAAHERGIVHRDLKPENVMRSPRKGLKVVDFGLARFERGDLDSAQRLTLGEGAVGTPGYMSPEQIRGDPVGVQSDQFAFGILIYELVTGRHPFDAADRLAMVAKLVETDPEPMTRWRPECPADLERIVRRCLAKRPAERYATSADLAVDLRAIKKEPTNRHAPLRPSAVETDGLPPLHPPPIWWWQFHQVAVSSVYCFTLIPLWRAREWMSEPWGLVTFVATVAVVGMAVNLRLHLWFTSRVYPAELAERRRRLARWNHVTDAGFVLGVLTTAITISRAHTGWAALLVAIAVTSAISARMVEPATTRATFPST